MTETTDRVACARSTQPRTADACHEVFSSLGEAMHGSADLVVCFFSRHHVRQAGRIGAAAREALAPDALIGSSASAVVGDDDELENQPGLVAWAASWPEVTVHTFTERDLNWPDAEKDPEALRAAVHAGPDLRGVMLLADPYVPLLRIIPAISEALPNSLDAASVPVFGGVASAGGKPGENRFLFQDEVRVGGIVGLAFSGRLRIDTLVSQGCRPIGRPMVITAAQHNLIHHLGGKPALEAFQEMLPTFTEQDRQLLQKGLFVGRVINEYKDRFGRGDFLIRNVVGVDRDRGFIMVNDFVRVGQTVQFHVRDAQTASEDLQLLLAAQQLHDPPLGGLLFTCTGRGSRMFSVGDHDAHTIRRYLPGTPLAGFFAAGEIGPVGNEAFLHGHTASLALFRPM